MPYALFSGYSPTCRVYVEEVTPSVFSNSSSIVFILLSLSDSGLIEIPLGHPEWIMAAFFSDVALYPHRKNNFFMLKQLYSLPLFSVRFTIVTPFWNISSHSFLNRCLTFVVWDASFKCYEVFAFCKFLRMATEMFYFFKIHVSKLSQFTLKQ